MRNLELDTMKQFLQKQPHRLTVAKHNLGIHQLRIMARAVEALQPFMSMEVDHRKKHEDISLKIKVSDLVVGKNVKPLREALDGLMKKVVRIIHYIEEDANFLEIGTTIIKEYIYEHGSEFIEVQISGHLLPQIIDLARGYTKYNINVAFNTSSPNVFKLYQYIAHFRDKKEIQCNVDTLRKWLQIENKYKMPSDVRKFILNPAMRELKEKADVWFSIAERVTKGRKMIGWRFNIYTKKEKKSDKKLVQERKKENEKMARRIKVLNEKYKLSFSQSNKLVANVDSEELGKELQQINYRIMNREIKNVGGYTAAALSKRFNVKL